jgi:hypothetical protein
MQLVGYFYKNGKNICPYTKSTSNVTDKVGKFEGKMLPTL